MSKKLPCQPPICKKNCGNPSLLCVQSSTSVRPMTRRQSTIEMGRCPEHPTFEDITKAKDDSYMFIDINSCMLCAHKDNPIEALYNEIPDFRKITPITYKIVHTTKFSVRGIKYIYHLLQGEKILLSSKTKSKHPNKDIHICFGSSCHISAPDNFRLIPTQSCTRFTLVKSGEDLMIIDIQPEIPETKTLFHSRVALLPSLCDQNMCMVTRPKHPTEDNGSKRIIYQLPSRLRFSEPAIICSKCSDSLSIEVMYDIPPIAVFSLGLSLFNARLKM